MMKPRAILTCLILLIGLAPAAHAEESEPGFDPEKDLLALHYDHAPDKDDGHSAAADRTILESMFGKDWIKDHVMAVSGVHGKNAKAFKPKSNKVMDVTWNDSIGWVAAHGRHEEAAEEILKRWLETLQAGGDVWVKEGGQSDLTADVVKLVKQAMPDLVTTRRIHVVQHSDWNENKTTDADLAYVKKQTHYIRIRDANRFLNIKGGDKAFEKAATAHPVFGDALIPKLEPVRAVDVLASQFTDVLDHIEHRTPPEADVQRCGVDMAVLLEAIAESALTRRPVLTA